MRWLILRIVIFVLLTMLTQIGGMAYLAAVYLVTKIFGSSWSTPMARHGVTLFVMLAFYFSATVFVVPIVAEKFGRVQATCMNDRFVVAANALTCWLNRGYVRLDVREKLYRLAEEFGRANADSQLTILETGFPFFDDFPLLPHLSHHDGRKVDLAFFYRFRDGNLPIMSGSPSPIGYFIVEPPQQGEVDTCAGKFAPLRWSFWWITPESKDWVLDETRTAALIEKLKADPHVVRLFVEPHLARRLRVEGDKVRFQGCRAARHDDHIHVEFD